MFLADRPSFCLGDLVGLTFGLIVDLAIGGIMSIAREVEIDLSR